MKLRPLGRPWGREGSRGDGQRGVLFCSEGVRGAGTHTGSQTPVPVFLPFSLSPPVPSPHGPTFCQLGLLPTFCPPEASGLQIPPVTLLAACLRPHTPTCSLRQSQRRQGGPPGPAQLPLQRPGSGPISPVPWPAVWPLRPQGPGQCLPRPWEPSDAGLGGSIHGPTNPSTCGPGSNDSEDSAWAGGPSRGQAGVSRCSQVPTPLDVGPYGRLSHAQEGAAPPHSVRTRLLATFHSHVFYWLFNLQDTF